MTDRAQTSPQPPTEKGQATRTRITATAAELIYEHGVARTSIEDIRRAAGVSGSQVAHYFAGKTDLVRAVIAYQAEAVIALHRSPALEPLDSFAALQRWAELLVKLQAEQGCVGGCRLGSLAGELAGRDPDLRASLAEAYGRWEEVLRTGLEAMRDRGELRADADPRRLALVLLSAHQGGVLLSQTTRSIRPLQSALTGALHYVRSFATDPGTEGSATPRTASADPSSTGPQAGATSQASETRAPRSSP